MYDYLKNYYDENGDCYVNFLYLKTISEEEAKTEPWIYYDYEVFDVKQGSGEDAYYVEDERCVRMFNNDCYYEEDGTIYEIDKKTKHYCYDHFTLSKLLNDDFYKTFNIDDVTISISEQFRSCETHIFKNKNLIRIKYIEKQ